MSSEKTNNLRKLIYFGKNTLKIDEHMIKELARISDIILKKFKDQIGEELVQMMKGHLEIKKDENRFVLSIIIREPLLKFYQEVTGESPYLDFGEGESQVKSFYDQLYKGNYTNVLNSTQQKKWTLINDFYSHLGKFYFYLETLFENNMFLKFNPELGGRSPKITEYSSNLYLTFELKGYGKFYTCPECSEKIIYRSKDFAQNFCVNENLHPQTIIIFDDDHSSQVSLDDGIHLLENNETGYLRYLAIYKRAKVMNSTFILIEKGRFLSKEDNVVVCVKNQIILGYLWWNLYAQSKCLRQVYVLLEYREKGIATDLFRWVLSDVSEFTVEQPNKLSIKLVKKFEKTHDIYWISGS